VSEWWGSMEDSFPFDEPESTRFTIWVDGEIAGLIQYGEEAEPMYRHAWIDVFVSSSHSGRGVGSEAVSRVVALLRDERGHHRVTIDPSVDNAPAIRAYEKAGFERVGVMKMAERGPDGRWRDALFMEQVFPAVAGITSDERSP
jgi:aminoglycoside 6'-N-acetyltransferase